MLKVNNKEVNNPMCLMRVPAAIQADTQARWKQWNIEICTLYTLRTG